MRTREYSGGKYWHQMHSWQRRCSPCVRFRRNSRRSIRVSPSSCAKCSSHKPGRVRHSTRGQPIKRVSHEQARCCFVALSCVLFLFLAKRHGKDTSPAKHSSKPQTSSIRYSASRTDATKLLCTRIVPVVLYSLHDFWRPLGYHALLSYMCSFLYLSTYFVLWSTLFSPCVEVKYLILIILQGTQHLTDDIFATVRRTYWLWQLLTIESRCRIPLYSSSHSHLILCGVWYDLQCVPTLALYVFTFHTKIKSTRITIIKYPAFFFTFVEHWYLFWTRSRGKDLQAVTAERPWRSSSINWTLTPPLLQLLNFTTRTPNQNAKLFHTIS